MQLTDLRDSGQDQTNPPISRKPYSLNQSQLQLQLRFWHHHRPRSPSHPATSPSRQAALPTALRSACPSPSPSPSPSSRFSSLALPLPQGPPLPTKMPHRVSLSPVLGRAGSGSSRPPPSTKCPQDSASVAQALEIERESPDGASDPTVSQILEVALAQVWAKVQAQPDTYVMTRDEFAVFNFFQHRFRDDNLAVVARKRYWDNLRA